MKFLHRIKAHSLRKKLIRKRAQNIADLRHGRREARNIAILLAREIRLSGRNQESAKIIIMPKQSKPNPGIGNIPKVLSQIPRMRKI